MANTATSLHAIVKRASLRDKKAQETLYRQYFPYVWEVARRYSRPDRNTASIAADAFADLFASLSSFDPVHSGFKTFVKNKVIDAALRQRSITYVPTVLTTLKEWDRLVPADTEKSLQALPAGVQMILVLSAIEGFGNDEIAERLQVKEAKNKQELAALTHYIQPFQPLVLKKIQSLPPVVLPDLDAGWLSLKERIEEQETKPALPLPVTDVDTDAIPQPIDPVEGQWTGWAFLFILIAASLLMLYMAGIIR